MSFPINKDDLPFPTVSGVYCNPHSDGACVIDTNEQLSSGVYLTKGILAGTGIIVTALDNDIKIDATGGGGIPDASETVKGVLELATQAETDAGSNDLTAVTPLKLRNTTLTSNQLPTVPFSKGGTGLTTLGAGSSFYLRTNGTATGMEWATIPPTIIPSATEVVQGAVRYATQAEVNAGTDASSVVRPNTLRTTVFTSAQLPVATDTTKGAIELATQAEVDLGGNSSFAVTPNTLRNTVFETSQIPSLDTNKITTGTLPIARGGTNLNTFGTANQFLSINNSGTSLEYINPMRSALSRIIYVDQIRGDDVTGAVSTTATDAIMPFKTLASALVSAGAISGSGHVVVYLSAGTYNIVAGLVLGDNISIVGVDASSVIINYTTSATSTMITMGNSCRLEQLTLLMNTTSNVSMTGITFPNATTTTSKIRNVFLDMSATGAGTGSVIGVFVPATSGVDPYFTNIRATTIRTTSIMTGTERGILVNATGAKLNCRDIIIWSTGIGGNCIGAETNATGCTLYLSTSTIKGITADISQTQGNIHLSSTCLHSGNANGKNFTQCTNTGQLVFSDPGGIGTSTPRYYRFGTYAIGTTEVKLKFNSPTVVRNLRVVGITAGSVTRVYTWYVRKNGVNTILSTGITNGDLTSANTTNTVQFNTGDELSISVEIGGTGTPALSDTTVTVDLY